MDDNTFISAGAITLILIQVLKILKIKFESKTLPLLSVAIAAVLNSILTFCFEGGDISTFDLPKHIFNGAVAGLTASGSYDAFISLLVKKNEEENPQ